MVPFWVRKLLFWSAFAALAAITILGYALLFSFEGDPFDKFDVVAVKSAPGGEHHAVVYRYHHANSSADSAAVWLSSGPQPAIGSKEPAKGAPVLVWFGAPQSIHLEWEAASRRFSARVNAAFATREVKQVEGCFFDYDQQMDLLCINTKKINLKSK